MVKATYFTSLVPEAGPNAKNLFPKPDTDISCIYLKLSTDKSIDPNNDVELGTGLSITTWFLFSHNLITTKEIFTIFGNKIIKLEYL